MNTLQQKWWVLLGVSLACLVAFIDFTIVSTALPDIQQNLDSSILQLQWVMNIFVLIISIFMVAMGRVGDILGQRFILLIGILLFGIASLGAGLSSNTICLIIFRGLQGLGTAILIPTSIAVISIVFPQNEVGRAMGIWTSITGIGLAIGPVLGGVIVSIASWRYVFLINIPLFIISFLICITYLEKRTIKINAIKQFDWFGLMLMGIAIAALVVPVVQSSLWGWTSPMTLSLFAISLIASILFVRLELRVKSPIIQFHQLSHRNFLTSAFANFCLVGFIWLAFFLLPLYLENVHGYSTLSIGFILLSVSGALTLISPLAGYLSDKVGAKTPILIGLSLLLLSAIGQSIFNVEGSVFYIVACLIVMGVAWGMIVGPAVGAAVQTVPAEFSGLAAGALWTIQNIGGALGLAIGSAIFTYREKIHFLTGIQKANLQLNSDESILIKSLLSDPDHLHQAVTQLPDSVAQHILPLFKKSFMLGFESAYYLFVALIILAIAIVMIVAKSTPRAAKSESTTVIH